MQIKEIREIIKEGMLIGCTTDNRYWENPMKIEFTEGGEDEHTRT